jgi:mevalonate pyrophosphate decarboxylase
VELHDDLDAEMEAVMAELDMVSASVSSSGSAAFSASIRSSGLSHVGTSATSTSQAAWGGPASSGHAPQTGYYEQWDKYDDYGEYVCHFAAVGRWPLHVWLYALRVGCPVNSSRCNYIDGCCAWW